MYNFHNFLDREFVKNNTDELMDRAGLRDIRIDKNPVFTYFLLAL